jgi:hypothetical protein
MAYDRRWIMSLAHVNYRRAGGAMTFSQALKAAWASAKLIRDGELFAIEAQARRRAA